MKLYYSPGTCSLAPHILLHDTQLPCSLVRVDTKTHRTETGEDFYSINGKGAVPVIELADGTRLSEGPIVSQYICDQANRLDLMPAAGSMERYRVMEWQNFVTSELHKSYSPLFGSALDSAAKDVYRASLRKRYEWIDRQLEGKSYLTGDTFTAADAYLFAVTRWSKTAGPDLGDLREVQSFMDRVGNRDAVQRAMTAEGLPTRKAA